MTANVHPGEALAERPTVAPWVVPSVGQVYATHAQYVFRCLRSLGVREAHLEDAVQDVFLVVNDKLGQFDGQAKLRTWLYAIVIRIARKFRARQSAEARTEADEGSDPSARTGEQALLSREQLALALRALSGLRDDKREVFVLSEIEQMSAPEIASATGTPLNTVYSRLRSARQEFERRMAKLTQAGRSPTRRGA